MGAACETIFWSVVCARACVIACVRDCCVRAWCVSGNESVWGKKGQAGRSSVYRGKRGRAGMQFAY